MRVLIKAQLLASCKVFSGVLHSLWPSEMRTLRVYLRLEGESLLRGQNNQRPCYSTSQQLGLLQAPSGGCQTELEELKALPQAVVSHSRKPHPEVKEPSRRHCTVQFLY